MEFQATELEPGQSVRLVCPFCGGGGTNEKCLSLTHTDDGALLFHCYRANCGASGRLGGSRRLVHTRPKPAKPSRVKENIEHRMECLYFHGRAWGMTAAQLHALGAMYDPETDRLALPIWSPQKILRGRVLRVWPDSKVLPKTLTWLYEDVPVTSWFGENWSGVVVVEDIPSAMRIARMGYRAVALNGTHMTDDAVEELDRNADSVLWALDPDATSKASAWCMRTRMYFNNSAVMMIDKDFKDMTDAEVSGWLSDTYWLRSSRVGTHLTG